MNEAISSVSGTTSIQMTTLSSLKVTVLCRKVMIKTQCSLQQDCAVAMCEDRLSFTCMIS